MEEWSVWRHSSRDVWLDLGYHLRSGLDLHAYELLIQNLGQDQKGLSARVKWNLRVKPWNWKALVPWKKSYDKSRQHIKKQRHHFADKSLYSQSYGFSSSHVYMWELDHKESWAPRNWCFELWCWRRLLVPWTAMKPSQSILKEICHKYSSLEGVILKLNLQYFGHLMWRTNSLEKTDAGKYWRQEKEMTG